MVRVPTISPAQFDWGNRSHRTPSGKRARLGPGAIYTTIRRLLDDGTSCGDDADRHPLEAAVGG
jgi:hypothetical protein